VAFDQSDWDEHLAVAELAVNNAKQASTGYSPFFLSYGREVSLPIDHAIAPIRNSNASSVNPAAEERADQIQTALRRAKQRIGEAQQRQARNVDAHRRAVTFRVGDSVLLSTENIQLITARHLKRSVKFAEQYIGPFKVKAVVNNNAYTLELPSQLQIHPTVNITRLKEYQDGRTEFPSRLPIHARPAAVASADNGAPAWEVEKILAKRGVGSRLQYLVKWTGYPIWESTWESKANVDGADEAIAEFNTQAADRLFAE
jgi:hypothetical protein